MSGTRAQTWSCLFAALFCFARVRDPGAASQPQPALSTLSDKLQGFKTRDLFASHARRAHKTRERVVEDAQYNPDTGGHRPHMARPLSAVDFPATRQRPQAIRGDRRVAPQRFIAAEPAHDPAHKLGLHRFAPSTDEKRVEDQVSALSAEHMERRAAEQHLKDSVAASMAHYARSIERRNEETLRRSEEPYRSTSTRKSTEPSSKARRRRIILRRR